MPTLPFELEQLIFETAALRDTDHDNRVRLSLVAKRVYEWIRPILYRVAITEEPEETSEETFAIRNWRNTQITDVAPFTRHLLVNSSSLLIDLLSTFHNVEDLAVWRKRAIDSQVLKKMNDLPLRILSIGLPSTSLNEAIEQCPALRNVTHLELTFLRGSTWDDCKALSEFPNLTHLCFDLFVDVEDEVVLGLLKHCSSLRALIYHKFARITIETDDPRFLVPRDRATIQEDFVEEWERSANGQIGFWELADIIIGARKNKLFENDSFYFSRGTWMNRLNEEGTRWYNESLRDGRFCAGIPLSEEHQRSLRVWHPET